MSHEPIEAIREKARRIIEEIPYQKIGDSPTLKYYARWSFIEKLNIVSHEPKKPLNNVPETYVDKKHFTIAFEGNKLAMYGKKYDGVSVVEINNESLRTYGGFLFRNISISETKLNAVHVAYFVKGAIVDIHKSISEPIRIIGFTSHRNVHVGYHLVYILRDNVNAELEIVSLGIKDADVLKTFVIEGFMGKNSKAKVTFVVKDSGKSFSYILHRIRSYDESKHVSHNLIISDNVTHMREGHVLSLKGETRTYGLMIGKNNSWQDYYTNVIHAGPYSSSRINVEGIALDSSTIIHRGLAKVLNSALESSSIIKSRMLILGNKAKANSAPMLEIETSNVKEAKHATSVSRLNEDHLFYMASRGISIEEAERLIIKGISDSFLEKISTPTRKFLGKLIYERLGI